MRLLLSPRASISFTALPATPPFGRVTVLVGPEGGFSAAEEAAATDHGFTAVGLGPRVLRTETAGIAVLVGIGRALGCLVSANSGRAQETTKSKGPPIGGPFLFYNAVWRFAIRRRAHSSEIARAYLHANE